MKALFLKLYTDIESEIRQKQRSPPAYHKILFCDDIDDLIWYDNNLLDLFTFGMDLNVFLS